MQEEKWMLEGKQLVYYDLETTGLGKEGGTIPINIVQIGAYVDDSNNFSCYVRPEGAIEPGATEVTGLYTKDGQLMKRRIDQEDEMLPAVDIHEGLTQFINFLKSQNHPVILMGHNIKNYDNDILRDEAVRAGLIAQLCQPIYGYIDTLQLFRRERPGLPSYSQQNLVQRYLGESYGAHEAIADVKALQRLVVREIDESALCEHINKWS